MVILHIFQTIKNVMLDGVMRSQIPSIYKMESEKEQFLPLCYSVYTLTKLLCCSTTGCQIQGVYMGIWVYADDIILLSPSRTGLQEMVKRNWVFATNPNFTIPIFLQPNDVTLWYFKLILFDITEVYSLKYQRFISLGC